MRVITDICTKWQQTQRKHLKKIQIMKKTFWLFKCLILSLILYHLATIRQPSIHPPGAEVIEITKLSLLALCQAMITLLIFNSLQSSNFVALVTGMGCHMAIHTILLFFFFLLKFLHWCTHNILVIHFSSPAVDVCLIVLQGSLKTEYQNIIYDNETKQSSYRSPDLIHRHFVSIL